MAAFSGINQHQEKSSGLNNANSTLKRPDERPESTIPVIWCQVQTHRFSLVMKGNCFIFSLTYCFSHRMKTFFLWLFPDILQKCLPSEIISLWCVTLQYGKIIIFKMYLFVRRPRVGSDDLILPGEQRQRSSAMLLWELSRLDCRHCRHATGGRGGPENG